SSEESRPSATRAGTSSRNWRRWPGRPRASRAAPLPRGPWRGMASLRLDFIGTHPSSGGWPPQPAADERRPPAYRKRSDLQGGGAVRALLAQGVHPARRPQWLALLDGARPPVELGPRQPPLWPGEGERDHVAGLDRRQELDPSLEDRLEVGKVRIQGAVHAEEVDGQHAGFGERASAGGVEIATPQYRAVGRRIVGVDLDHGEAAPVAGMGDVLRAIVDDDLEPVVLRRESELLPGHGDDRGLDLDHDHPRLLEPLPDVLRQARRAEPDLQDLAPRLDEELPGHQVAQVVELDVPGASQPHRALYPDGAEMQVANAPLVGHHDGRIRRATPAPARAAHCSPISNRFTRRTKPAGSSSCPPSASSACS